jgi:hypothetical protein
MLFCLVLAGLKQPAAVNAPADTYDPFEESVPGEGFALSCLALCLVLSCLVLSCLVLSCIVLCYFVLSCAVL